VSDTIGANKENSKLTLSDIVTATQRGKYTQKGKINNSGCHNCDGWKSEIKSLSEAIKIITGEIKPSDANIEAIKLTPTDPVGTTQCSKCIHLELQLQATLEEVSSLKAIVNVLNDDIKSSKSPTRTNRDTNNLWTVVSANNSRSSWTTTQPKRFSRDASYSLQYAVPTSNRYEALSSRHQTNGTKFLPDIEHQSRHFHEVNLNYAKKLHRKKSPMEFHIQNSSTHLPTNHNLQEANMEKEEPKHIPTIVNGVVRVNSKVKKEPKFSDIADKTINDLRQNIKNHTNNEFPTPSKHRIICLGDSHLRGYARSLQSIVNKNYDILGIVKPGSCSNVLKESVTEGLTQCSLNDQILINIGTNDYELNGLVNTYQNIRNFLMHNNHTNILLMSIPFRFDLPNYNEVNNKILTLNNKLEKLVRILPHVRFIYLNNDRNLYTRHGLHHNKLGKTLFSLKLAECILTTFAPSNSTSIPLDWYDDRLGNTSHCDSTQITLNRTSIRNKKTPITRSNDFLWMS